ncbi:TPD1 protein homolog 1-like [Spinacia oleracea]|uniref:TPD1 protein homolog 1-like n=1 Tax=Spinacia oleracea TaxID=3562 RepID=A0ABM3QR07_SPIOL|nr:TPD1 protein homolog 1-like [Spinacia oleracea]
MREVVAQISKQGGGTDGQRIGEGFGNNNTCSTTDVYIAQIDSAPLPSGIPTYNVIIVNACASGCSISDIHVKCEDFSSVETVNPTLFRRLAFDNCLVNDGNFLAPGKQLSFQYANDKRYDLSVFSVAC